MFYNILCLSSIFNLFWPIRLCQPFDHDVTYTKSIFHHELLLKVALLPSMLTVTSCTGYLNSPVWYNTDTNIFIEFNRDENCWKERRNRSTWEVDWWLLVYRSAHFTFLRFLFTIVIDKEYLHTRAGTRISV